MKRSNVLLTLFVAISLVLLASFAHPAEAAKDNKKRAVMYHVPAASSSSNSPDGSSDYDYVVTSPLPSSGSTSPIAAGQSGWDTWTSTSFDPNVHIEVGNSTAEKAFAYTSSPASHTAAPVFVMGLIGIAAAMVIF